MKEKLAKCKTYQESKEVFESMTLTCLRDFYTSLLNADKYVELTGRDYGLMSQAKGIIANRESKPIVFSKKNGKLMNAILNYN